MIDLIDDDSIAVQHQMIPKDLLQPALFVAKIKGFSNLDQYIIRLIEDDLNSIKDGAQGFNDLGTVISKDTTTNNEDLK